MGYPSTGNLKHFQCNTKIAKIAVIAAIGSGPTAYRQSIESPSKEAMPVPRAAKACARPDDGDVGDLQKERLPARFARLASVTTIVVLPPSASALASTAETAIIGLRAGLVNVEGTSAELLAIQGSDGLLRFPVVAHLYEAKSARASGLAICNHGHTVNVAEWLKQLAKIILRGAEREVADKNFHIRPLQC